jgi:F-type H+-transporting ATPase subunit b
VTIDFWGLGLQAINVLILVWLLARFFWRPVAGAITRRQETALAMLDDAKAAQDKADAELSEVTLARTGIAAERETLLAAARVAADAETAAALADAQGRAETLQAAARTALDRDTRAARRKNVVQASELSVDIAARLLGGLNTPMVQARFLDLLLESIARMSASDRAALVTAAGDIEIATATVPADADRAKIKVAVIAALGGAPSLKFVTNPDLIAGLELRSAHFVLHNSWRADLETIVQELKHAA